MASIVARMVAWLQNCRVLGRACTESRRLGTALASTKRVSSPAPQSCSSLCCLANDSGNSNSHGNKFACLPVDEVGDGITGVSVSAEVEKKQVNGFHEDNHSVR
jgi:hypothetical protein